MSNPIYRKDGFYYFHNESWSEFYGPYSTKEAAKAALSEYYKWLEPTEKGND